MDLREKILGLNDRPLTEVEVPEWGCTVYIRIASAREIENILDRIGDFARRKVTWSWRAWILQQLLCNEDGTPIFTGEDFKKLGDKNGVVIKRLHKLSYEVNGLVSGADEAEEEDEVEDDSKNDSEETNDSGSGFL